MTAHITDVIDESTLTEDEIARLIAPIDAYLARAANRPVSTPLDVMFAEMEARFEAEPPRALALPSTMTFFNDISEYQDVVNTATYPFPVISFRVDSGWRTDAKAAANWAKIRVSAKIQVALAYVVFIPGQVDATFARVRKLFGANVPAKVAFMVDMESGGGFAGAGDHSAEANRLLKLLASWANSSRRVVAYANRWDFISLWPNLTAGVKRIVASYGTVRPSSAWGWQYAGGDPRWASPAGFPRSVAGFGSHVDFNVVYRTLAQVKSDLGIALPPPPPKPPAPKPTYKTVTVRSGNTLGGIASANHTTWQQLVTWNKAKYPTLVHNPDLIHIGWVLRVSK